MVQLQTAGLIGSKNAMFQSEFNCNGTEKMNEEWKAVPGFAYEVSSVGRVRRTGVARGAKVGRVLKAERQNGYPHVTLWRNNVGTDAYIHILVCRLFNGDPPTPDHEVAHCDGSRTNNAAENLRWATHKENQADKIGHGTQKVSRRRFITETDVLMIRDLLAKGNTPAEIVLICKSEKEELLKNGNKQTLV